MGFGEVALFALGVSSLIPDHWPAIRAYWEGLGVIAVVRCNIDGQRQGSDRATGKRSHGQGLDAVVENHATEEAFAGLSGEAAQAGALGRLNAGRSLNVHANKLAIATGDHDIHLQLIFVAIPCRDT